MTTALPSAISPRRRFGQWIVLLLTALLAMAFLLWAGRDQRSCSLWEWDQSFRLLPGLPYLFLAAAALFTVLCFLAYLLFTTPRDAWRLPWWASAAIVILWAIAIRVAILRQWPTASSWWPVAADLLAVALLIAALLLQGRSVWWAALYAWHPLVLVEVARGHAGTSLAPLFVALAAALWLLEQRLPHHRPWPPATIAATVLAALAGVIAFLNPFAGPWPATPDATSLVANLLYRRWHLFNPTWVHLELWLLFALALATVLALGLLRRWPAARLLGHGLLVGLLLTPAPEPGLALWPLALLPLAWNRATWVLSATICGAWALRAAGTSHGPDWLLLLTWVPPLVVEIAQVWRDVDLSDATLVTEGG